MIEQKIWGLIPTYIKNQLIYWFDDKECLKVDVIGETLYQKKS